EVCRIVLMQLLPAIVEQDCKCFGQGLTRIQNITGKYFKNFQGGQFSSHQVECVTNRLLELGATGTGQTSWGPTGFALFGSETDAFQAMKKIRNEYKNNRDLEILICSPRNKKADIQIEE
ncbi:MAG: GHMP kinase, partial [Candidatus Aminicenantes bacterium]|nr:GHMP kinase [Candidatus Aminicenantes bacterium]